MWLRAFADHAAAAIANARAFDEIEQLRKKVELENEYLQEEVRTAHAFNGIVGESETLGKVLNQVGLVAPTDSTVLISGESGTGKELIARAIHERSRRNQRPMVKVNCAAIPKELFESEFFGHTKGAFTGAVRNRVGRFQLAHQATLFLDEVSEIPPDLQSKLLRVLQEGTFERVGDGETHTVNVRVIAATNRSLEEYVKAGRFREDLYYRLNVFPITVSPLRERLEDIPALAMDCIEKVCRRMGVPPPRLKRVQIQALQSYEWPGNVRELQNVIERAVITARGAALNLDVPEPGEPPAPDETSGSQAQTSILTYAQLKNLEHGNLIAALEKTDWRIAGPEGTAELLGVNASTLRSRLKAMGIKLGRRPL